LSAIGALSCRLRALATLRLLLDHTTPLRWIGQPARIAFSSEVDTDSRCVRTKFSFRNSGNLSALRQTVALSLTKPALPAEGTMLSNSILTGFVNYGTDNYSRGTARQLRQTNAFNGFIFVPYGVFAAFYASSLDWKVTAPVSDFNRRRPMSRNITRTSARKSRFDAADRRHRSPMGHVHLPSSSRTRMRCGTKASRSPASSASAGFNPAMT
jgi:hypothetical protein